MEVPTYEPISKNIVEHNVKSTKSDDDCDEQVNVETVENNKNNSIKLSVKSNGHKQAIEHFDVDNGEDEDGTCDDEEEAFEFSSSDLSDSDPETNTIDVCDNIGNQDDVVNNNLNDRIVKESHSTSSAPLKTNVVEQMVSTEASTSTTNTTITTSTECNDNDVHDDVTLTMDKSVIASTPCVPDTPSALNNSSIEDSLASEDGNAICHYLGMANEIVGYIVVRNSFLI